MTAHAAGEGGFGGTVDPSGADDSSDPRGIGERLTAAVENGAVDTVLVMVVDMQGRLQGKRVDARFFLDQVAELIARKHFGDAVVDHYTNMARVELDGFDAAVTDWERYRGFERL